MSEFEVEVRESDLPLIPDAVTPLLGGTPRVLTVRKTSNGTLFISATNGTCTEEFAIGASEVQYELLSVIRDDGPREFILAY